MEPEPCRKRHFNHLLTNQNNDGPRRERLGAPLEAIMESLVFACPKTGRTIDSGIGTSLESLSEVQEVELVLKCPHCAGRHQFPIKSGSLAHAA
jgi:hypothetical protein